MEWKADSITGWLLRGVAISVIAVIVALWVLVDPLSAPSPPLPTGPSSTATGMPSPTRQPSPTADPSPTALPTPTPTPTHVPSPPATPTPTPPPSPIESPNEPSPTPTVTAPLAGRVETGVYVSETAGGEARYRVYLPPAYDTSDSRYPALYLFHGWPYEAAHWDGLGVEQTADSAIQTGSLPPFIIVQPQGTEALYINTAGGLRSFEGQVINDLIPYIDTTYRTQVTREGRAIGGISRGGVWALEIGLSHADMFTAIGAHSPALSVNMAPPAYDPFTLLKQPGVREQRIYLDAGDADWAREGTEELHRALEAEGIGHQYVVHEGGHARPLWASNLGEYLAFYTAGW